ncbi:MAG: hypothetical protein J7501_16415 [Bdellovibrio sp.]|nr:hypothetical protein [Bdellovibrio sp.]
MKRLAFLGILFSIVLAALVQHFGASDVSLSREVQSTELASHDPESTDIGSTPYVCQGGTPPAMLTSLTTEDQLDWWSVKPDQVANAPCKNHYPPTDQVMLDALKPSSLGKESALINGISFKDEDPKLLQLFRDLHTYDVSKVGAPPLILKSACTKVLCAVKEIYGQREGVQILYMLSKFGFNGSHLRTAAASLWKSTELDDVLTALSDYPDELYPLDYNRKLVHYTRGKRMPLPEGESVANSTMEIYDMWNDLTQAERQQSLLHELGHVVARKDNVDESKGWYDVAGWKERTRTVNGKVIKDYVLADRSKAVSLYGMTNSHEDFAESVVAYRFGAANFKTSQAGKYAFLKDHVFDGKEYLTADSCRTSKSRTEQRKETNNQVYNKVLASAQKRANNLDSDMTEKAQNICLDTLVKSMAGEAGSSSTCTSRALQGLQLLKASRFKRPKVDITLLSDQQLDRVALKPETEKEFNRLVRNLFAKNLTQSIASNERDPASSNLYKSGGTPAKGCEQWATFAQTQISNSDLTQPLRDKDKNYFVSNRRYERVHDFMTKSCLSTIQSAGRLDLGILQNLP